MIEELKSKEIYPKIIVYKNVFKDINKIFNTIKESNNNNEDRLFEKWTQWSSFGEYMSPVLSNSNINIKGEVITKEDFTENQKNHKEVYEQIVKNFYLVTKDYCNKNNIDLFNNIDETIINYQNQTVKKWIMSGPSICKYHISNENKEYRMNYHTDYVAAERKSPGHNFAITALAYFNDDYEGGELDFCIGKKLLKYKPQAGDYIVFPSGHPEILTEDGEVYLHGVMPAKGEHKYFSRMYWKLYQDASNEWIENESKFGKNIWWSMQDELFKEYYIKYPQRSVIEDGVRIQ